MTVRLTILYDNTAVLDSIQPGWGFSCLVERQGAKVLFDTGWDGELLLRNASKLNVSLDDLDAIVISHDHWDHIGGLATVLAHSRCPTVFLTASTSKRLCAEIAATRTVVTVSSPCSVADGITSSGELGDDPTEQCLFIEAEDGLIVLTGCAHPGLTTFLELGARRGDLLAAIGGFHGFNQLEALADVPFLIPLHCTVATDDIKAAYPHNTWLCGAGSILDF